jgi:hypothetical protein
MEYCKFCEVDIEDNHPDYTCWQNELNYLMSSKTCDREQWQKDEIRKKELRDLLADNFECDITYKSFDTLEQVLEHEHVTFNAKVIDRQDKMYKSISCSDCGQKFYDRGQKMPVKYLLNRHKKKCSLLQSKNLKISLKQFIAETDNINKLKKMLAIANSHE